MKLKLLELFWFGNGSEGEGDGRGMAPVDLQWLRLWLRWYEVSNKTKGTAKAIKKWIYVCPWKKLVRRIQYVGVYLSVRKVSV